MTCPTCAQHVTKALLNVPGVLGVHLPGWESGQATVQVESGVVEEQLTEAVAAAGYHASVAARESQPDLVAHGPSRAADFDLLVIGGGSAGFAGAIKGAELGYKIALVNDGILGGTCVNVGCVPSKTLIRAAEAWHRAGHQPFEGVIAKQVSLDWNVVREQKDALVDALRQEKYVNVLAAYPQIAVISGRALFRADGSVQAGERTIRARKYLIATGARPRMVPIPGAQEVGVLNSTTLMDLPTLPESLIVLGGRAVALELSQTMARFGVQVTLLQRSDRIIPDHEPELAESLQEYLREEGMQIVTGARVERIALTGDRRVVRAHVNGQARAYSAQQVLMALGREPNTAGLGLEAVNVMTDEAGAVVVDGQMRTSNPAIYAAGDVTTNPHFVYVAAAGGTIAAENALTDANRVLDLSAMPAVIFTDPQVATVGLQEAEARQMGYDVKVSILALRYVPRALAARDTRGFIKLVADGSTGRLLGAHILAAEAGEVVQSAALAVRFGFTLDDITGTLFPYLTQVEGLKLAAQAFGKDVSKLSCCAG